MQSIQEHRDDGEGREQDRAPSFPQPTYPAGMAGQQQFPRQPYQGQPPVVVQNYYQAPPIATPVMVEVRSSGPSFLARALWFIFVGWWLGLIWLHIGYALCVTGIFLPVGLLMLNRLPAVVLMAKSGVGIISGVVSVNGCVGVGVARLWPVKEARKMSMPDSTTTSNITSVSSETKKRFFITPPHFFASS